MRDDITVEGCPIVEVVWEDHSTVTPDGGESWADLVELMKKAEPVLVHEVGYILVNEPNRIVMAHCLAEDEGSKGVSVILPRDIKEWCVLREAKSGD